jgi:Lrp/AsnC family transcriptional regulator for asnA, asnC and gidA
MIHDIDKTDQELIRLLRKDGRIPGPKLSAILGISLPTVYRRINRLLVEGIIRITAFIDLSKAGTECAALYCMNVPENSIGAIKSKLLDHPNVARVSRTTGRYNLTCNVVFERISEMSRFHLITLPRIDGVYSFDPMIFLLPEAASNLKLAGVEKRIFEQLREQGRASSAEIAKRLGLSTNLVRDRINRLVSPDGFIAVKAVVNPDKVDWFFPAVIGISAKQPSVASIVEKLSGELKARNVVPTSGRYNIVIFMPFESDTELYRFVNKKIRTIEGVIDCEIFKEKEIAYGNNYFASSGAAGLRNEKI